ncbi:MAG: glycoside hydrolase family 76 protein [Verrucomicrobiota bacterium]
MNQHHGDGFVIPSSAFYLQQASRWIRVACWFVCVWLSSSGRPALAYTAKEVETLSSAFTSAFYSLSQGTNGYFKDTQTGGITYFWGQAEMIECVIDAYEWNGNPTHGAMITNLLNGFIKNNGSAWNWNIYNDDIMWAVLAFARGGAATGRSNYIAIAKSNFDMCYARAWDSVLGGGLYWTTDNQSKNACVNGPGAIAAYLLYQIYGDASYLTKATNIYAWQRATLYNPSTGGVFDNIQTNGNVNGGSTTYNQGTFIGAAHFLGYTNDAMVAARFTMMNMTSSGILPEYGIAGNNSGFNAIFIRWLMRFMRDRNLQTYYQPWLQLNATAAWNGRRAGDNLSWCQWQQASPVGTNFYAWDGIASFEVMQAALPTQGLSPFPVPQYPIGEWALNATSGTVALDASGDGNHGLVTNATWSSSGRLNGCLVFNGVNSVVQVTNRVGNDFSIAFWVKTTQTAGAPQWYNGVGLVDGDVPFNNNDFGTALVGGKFAFGVGNPDTTIVSTASINDGSWHHCVATRDGASGAIRIYVDGGLQATGTGTRNTLSASTRLLFGVTGGNYFNGSLDDVKIFTRTLASNEVTALYASTMVAPTSAPTNLTAVATNTKVQLNWTGAAGGASYNVKRALVSGGPYTTITNVITTAFTDTTVLSNRTYYYVVSGMNVMGEGVNSAEVSASPVGLVAWFRADSLTNLADGAAVALWPDASGNGCDASQPLAANRPTFVANAINGQPAVRFNAANSAHLLFARPVQDDFTIVILFRSTQGISTGVNFWEGAGLVNGERSGSVGDFGLALNSQGRILAGVGNPDTTISSGTGFNNGSFQVVTFRRVRSSGLTQLYLNGALVASGVGGTQSLTAPSYLVLGGQGVLNNFLTGDLAEVRVFGTALSDADRLGHERVLRSQYGLSGGVAPAAPTGLTGTANNRRVTLNWLMTAGATGYNLWRSTNGAASFDPVATGMGGTSFVDTTAISGVTNYYRVTAQSSCGAGASSATLAVFLPLPALEMSASGGTLTLSWPAWATDWGLYATTNLTSPVLWSPVSSAVSSNNGLWQVTLPIGPGTEFFRLVSP